MEILTCYVLLKQKIDSSFPIYQFSLEGYHSPYHLGVRKRRGGINPSILTRQLKCEIRYKCIQIIPFEINLKKEKCLVVSIYPPPLQNSEYNLNAFTDIIDYFSRVR